IKFDEGPGKASLAQTKIGQGLNLMAESDAREREVLWRILVPRSVFRLCLRADKIETYFFGQENIRKGLTV
ncbi:MAG: hypothetical protein NC911_08420, partial [Candidatus Omnitrophica bacterium]|nr:hypothetical protein [Candidatus Omnitrophota bacterium]